MKALRGCGLLPWLVLAASLLVLRPAMGFAATDKPQHLSVSINTGSTYVISHVDPNSTPGVRVINNPHALVVHNEEPGKIVLLGTEAGEWAIDVQLTDGTSMTYDVSIKSIPNPITEPATSFPSFGSTSTGASGGSKLDSGAGPVDIASDKSAPSDTIAVSSGKPGSSTSTISKDSSDSAAGSAGSSPGPTEPVVVADSGKSSLEAAAESAAANAGSPTVSSAPPAAPPVTTSWTPPGAEKSSAPSSSPAAGAINPVIPSQTASANQRFRANNAIANDGGNYETDAVNGGTHFMPGDVIALPTSTSLVIDYPTRIRRVSIADTNIADIQVVNPFQLNLIAHKPGFTTLAVWDSQGQYTERQVRIDPHGKQQVMLNCIVAELDRSRVENTGINLSLALPGANTSVVGLPGTVATPYSPSTSINSSSSTTSSTGSTGLTSEGATLPFGGQLIPLLLSPAMTYGVATQSGAVATQGFFQYLESHQLAKILAEPHLLANSGEKASFLSGGEIPIVVSQALNTSIVYKEFGTKVQFLPTVVGRDQIELLVAPEVSQPNFALGVNENGFTVPAFQTRRAQTFVRLRDDQTLIIAGLIEHNKTSTVNKVPYLGDMPYLGALFKTTAYNATETDLVMSVTPQIVRPLAPNSQLYNPYDTPEMTTEQIETQRLTQPDAARPRF
ncbi:MAG TPA: pilus assembly protein N-terminal domain-containing protein [Candidatus Binataceae bacterium]|nr:pilus assembly protein N-terminal domain-containing protein [Candidatus Binataceae bacterium]